MLCDMEKEVIDGDATGATVKKSNVITPVPVKEGKRVTNHRPNKSNQVMMILMACLMLMVILIAWMMVSLM